MTAVTSLFLLSILLLAYDFYCCEVLESDEHPELSATVEQLRKDRE